MQHSTAKNYYGEIALFIGTILAAAGWFTSKMAIMDFPPLAFLSLRFMIAGLLFLPFAYKRIKVLSFKQLVMSVLVGLFFAGNLMTWIFALKLSHSIGEGAFIMSLSMLLAPLISWAIFRNRPSGIFWLALPVSVAGLYCLVAGQGGLHFSSEHSLFLVASLCIAFYFVLLNQFAKQINPLALTTIMLFVVGIICTLYSYCTESWQINTSPETWWWIVLSIVIATNLRFLIQAIGQRHCSISNSAIIMLLEPVWTLWFSVWLLDEIMSGQKLVGCGLILLSLLIYRLPMILKRQKVVG